MRTEVVQEDATTGPYEFEITSKPWIESMIHALKGFPPTEQILMLWMAYLADNKGVLDSFTWPVLGDLTGLQPDSLRKITKKDLEVYSEGLLSRHPRQFGGMNAIPMFKIHVKKFYTPNQTPF